MHYAETRIADDTSMFDATTTFCKFLIQGALNLKGLDLRRCALLQEQYQAVLSCLTVNTKLEYINLSQCELLTKQSKRISQTLKESTGFGSNDCFSRDEGSPISDNVAPLFGQLKARPFPVRRKSALEKLQRPRKEVMVNTSDESCVPNVLSNLIIQRVQLGPQLKARLANGLLERLSQLDATVPSIQREIVQAWSYEHDSLLSFIGREYERRFQDSMGGLPGIALVLLNPDIRSSILSFRGIPNPIAVITN